MTSCHNPNGSVPVQPYLAYCAEAEAEETNNPLQNQCLNQCLNQALPSHSSALETTSENFSNGGPDDNV